MKYRSSAQRVGIITDLNEVTKGNWKIQTATVQPDVSLDAMRGCKKVTKAPKELVRIK